MDSEITNSCKDDAEELEIVDGALLEHDPDSTDQMGVHFHREAGQYYVDLKLTGYAGRKFIAQLKEGSKIGITTNLLRAMAPYVVKAAELQRAYDLGKRHGNNERS